MLTAKNLASEGGLSCASSPIAPSAFPGLDSLTGGMVPGRAWIVIGAPGQGRTTLLTQWAATIADRRDAQTVQLVTPRDSWFVIRGRLLSLLGRIPLDHLTSGRMSDNDQRRLSSARERLTTLQLELYAKDGGRYTPEVDPFRHPPGHTALVVDDADLVSGVGPDWVAACADAGVFVLISLPRHLVMAGPDDDADVEPAWARVADVILEVRHRGLWGGALRPGEAELGIRYNRWGYLRTINALHQAHFSRFVEATP